MRKLSENIDIAKKIYELNFRSAYKWIETGNFDEETKKLVRDAKDGTYFADDMILTSDIILQKMGYFYDYSDYKLKKILI